MNKIFILFSLVIFLNACRKKETVPVAKPLNTEGIGAVGAYFTHDNKGNVVLCWTEQDRSDSLNRLKYAIYDRQEDKFSPAISVPASAGSSTSPESMGKIAFKDDGTVVAIFAKQFPKENNPYAGAIYYSTSKDGGNQWSDAEFLHSDTAHNCGRSFFDIARLKDGELAAVWLDGRYGKSIKGSALFFSRTEKGKGFAADTCLDKGTCECCRTEILTDDAGNIHLAYRSIIFPSAFSGKQVRDMVYKLSTDNGKTFSAAKMISKDNWQIEGCPHSGPSLAVINNAVYAVWFTAGGSSGLYFTSASTLGGDFHNRSLITASGRHPQMITLSGEKTVMVCEEAANEGDEHTMKMDHSGGGKMHHGPAGAAKIVLTVIANGNAQKTMAVTNGQYPDNHAVLIAVRDRLLIAWVREEKKGSRIYYSALNAGE